MGIISISDTDKLFWAGRYGERALAVFTRYISLPSDCGVRKEFAARLCLFQDNQTPDDAVLGAAGAVAESVVRWHDNAVKLRHILSGCAVRQAEVCVNALGSQAQFDELTTHIYAFFAICDDELRDNTARCIVRAGRMVERLDILSRLGEQLSDLEWALERLTESVNGSQAAKNLISRCQLELAERDLENANVSAIKLRTPYMENFNELS